MKPQLALCCCLLAAAAQAQIRVDRMRADIGFLSSEPLEGRRALQRGSDVAEQFVAAEFAKAGLRPANDGSYLQEFTLIEYRPGERRMTVRRNGKTRECGLHEFSGSFPNDVTVEGPAVFAGYGVTAPEYGYDDYAGIDVRGKIVLILDREPQEADPQSVFHGRGNTRHSSPRLKMLNAQRHGAAAVLTILKPSARSAAPTARSTTPTGPAARTPGIQALSADTRIPAFTITDELAAELLGRKPAELRAAIDAGLKPASREVPGVEIRLQVSNSEYRRARTANVIGMIEGSDPQLKDETILFTGHYDHLGIRAGSVLPGADDNASGTAGVIELARVFAASPEKPKRTLLFVAFGAEEPGLLGSYYYTAHPLRPLAKTRAVINLDMIGRDEKPSAQTNGLIAIDEDTSNELNLIGTKNSPELRALLERSNREVGLKLNYKWEDDTALNVLWRCDHFPFLLENIPAVWCFNGFTPDYHQPTDSIEKLNFTKMEKIVRLAYVAGRALAGGAPAPRFQ